jgi:drug/metabolite transporter (DMT)-like permease
MALMTLAMQIVPITDAIAKLLTANSGLGVAQVAWARLAVGTLFLLPLGASSLPLRSGKRAVWHALRPHWLRGTCWAGASLFFFAAIKDNPLPNALALIFIAPLFVTITAPLLLGEAFSFRCVAASAVGFIGVLIVLRPAADDFSPALSLALVAGLCYGGYIIATRYAQSRSAGGDGHTAFMAMLTAAIISTPLAFLDWQAPTAGDWLLIITMGGLSALGHFTIAKSCKYAGASQVAPFHYTEIIGASTLSWWLFNELPTANTTVGIMLIIAAGIYVSLIQQQENLSH